MKILITGERDSSWPVSQGYACFTDEIAEADLVIAISHDGTASVVKARHEHPSEVEIKVNGAELKPAPRTGVNRSRARARAIVNEVLPILRLGKGKNVTT